MPTASAPTTAPGTFRDMQRRLRALDVATPEPGAPTLEAMRPASAEPPRLARATLLEDKAMRRRAVPGTPTVGVTAFLDGIQASRILHYDGSVPIIHGSVAAVIRIRDSRQLRSWSSVSESRVYAPLALVSQTVAELLNDL
ncbi:MAG TPA: hypothetical protein VIV65_04595, partial [Gemmatimonadaceae bacterium]